MKTHQSEREELEIKFWQEDPDERPGAFSIKTLMNKFGDAIFFYEEISSYKKIFSEAGVILELGGGQCWASCIVKHLYPGATVIASDISKEALESSSTWEAIYRAAPDRKVACRSYEIPLPDESVDLIFVFQAAHHFGRHGDTLREARRILRPNGTMLYLHEPACSRLVYKAAYRRVNALRPSVHEDLLIFDDMRRLAAENGLTFELVHRGDLSKRGFMRTSYYQALALVKPLRKILPNTVDFIFSRAT